jgi:hypothetical protein
VVGKVDEIAELAVRTRRVVPDATLHPGIRVAAGRSDLVLAVSTLGTESYSDRHTEVARMVQVP